MAKKQVVTLKTQALELVKAMGLEVPTIKQFEREFLQVGGERDDNDSKWVELSVEAPIIFGEGCFTKERAAGEEWNEDYAFLKTTLEDAVCMDKYGIAMPEIVRVKPGTVLTAKQTQERKVAQDVRAKVGTAINRMSNYFEAQVGAEKKVRPLPTLAAWCGTAVVSLTGKPETTKAKAIAPKISGHVPQVLIDLLACYTIADAKEHAIQMQAWREGVAKELARTSAVKAISSIQNRARKAVKSDAAKQLRKVAA